MVTGEILGHSDSQQQTADPVNHDNALINRLGREGEVVGLGISEGFEDGIKSLPSHIPQIAESLGIGYALGAAAQFGTAGKIVAMGAGAFMLGDWAYHEITGGRWEKIGGAVSDAWNSSANMNEDIQTSREQLGSFAFDTAIAFGAGGLGAKVGYSNFAEDGLGTRFMEKYTGKSPADITALNLGNLMPDFSGVKERFSSLTGQREALSYGMSSKVGDAGATASVFAQAAEFLKPKEFKGLDQIKDAWLHREVESDGVYSGLKEELQHNVDEHQQATSRSNQLAQELAQHAKDLKQLKGLTPQRLALQSAQDDVEFLKNQQETVLPQTRAELKGIEDQLAAKARAKELARKQTESEGGQKGALAAKSADAPAVDTAAIDLKARRSDLGASVRDLVDQTSPEAFQRARVRVSDAQEALRQAQENAPAKIAELETTMQIKQSELAAHQQNIVALNENTLQLLNRLEARRSKISADPSIVVPRDNATVTTKPAVQAKAAKTGKPASTVPAAEAPAVAPISDVVSQTEFSPPANEARTATVDDRIFRRLSERSSEASPELVALRSTADSALQTAQENIKPFNADRELRAARHQKTNIESGRLRFSSADQKAQALAEAEVRIAKATQDVKSSGHPRYAQTVRSLRDYADAAGDYIARDGNPTARDEFAKQAVINLETLMPSVDNLYRAVNGSPGELARININATFDPYQRLDAIQEHLEGRINSIDAHNLKRNSRLVQDNPVFAELQGQLNDLPSDGAIFFFNNKGEIVKGPMTYEGKLVGADGARYRMDALRPDGTVSGADGNPVKVRTTYKAIDVQRWQRFGVDVNGAGMDRFKTDDVASAAIVRPKYDNTGNPIEIRKFSKRGGGKPTIAKEVVGTVGDVPEGVTPGMSLGNLVKKFDPDQPAARPQLNPGNITAEQNVEQRN